jgi:hypothetical protein
MFASMSKWQEGKTYAIGREYQVRALRISGLQQGGRVVLRDLSARGRGWRLMLFWRGMCGCRTTGFTTEDPPPPPNEYQEA